MNSTRKRRILELAGSVKGRNIVDVGCATGYFAKEIKEKGAANVIGIDIAKEAVNKAKKILDEAYVVDIQTERFPLEDESADVVFFTETIEHLFPKLHVT